MFLYTFITWPHKHYGVDQLEHFNSFIPPCNNNNSSAVTVAIEFLGLMVPFLGQQVHHSGLGVGWKVMKCIINKPNGCVVLCVVPSNLMRVTTTTHTQ